MVQKIWQFLCRKNGLSNGKMNYRDKEENREDRMVIGFISKYLFLINKNRISKDTTIKHGTLKEICLLNPFPESNLQKNYYFAS